MQREARGVGNRTIYGMITSGGPGRAGSAR